MPKFSPQSEKRLNTCAPDLRRIFWHVIQNVDCSILEGHRDEKRQGELYAAGATKVNYPNSKHNTRPSRAIDVAPYPVDWGAFDRADALARVMAVLSDPKDAEGVVAVVREIAEETAKRRARWYYMGGYVAGVADQLGTPVRWGGDWDGDEDFSDQTFDDLVHFELVD